MTLHHSAKPAYRAALRAIADGPEPGKVWPTSSALAAFLGRDLSNLRKGLSAMHKAGLITSNYSMLTSEGRALLDELEAESEISTRLKAIEGAGDPDANVVLHEQITPDALNPRKDFDEAGLDELAASIRDHGLLQNLIVRPPTYSPAGFARYRLVSGERRWRAIGKLIAAGDWPSDRPIAILIRGENDEEHATLALIENLQRQDLKPLEEAQAIKALVDNQGLGTAEIARRVGLSQRWVQERIRLLNLPGDKLEKMQQGEFSIEDARKHFANQPKAPTLSDRAWLIALEAFDARAELEAGHMVPANKPTDPADIDAVAELAAAYILELAPQVDADHRRTGTYGISFRYMLDTALELKFGPEVKNPDLRAVIISEFQAPFTAIAPITGPYVSAFLNPPYQVDLELQAEQQAIAAALAASAEKIRQADEERRRRLAEADQITESLIRANAATPPDFEPAAEGFHDLTRRLADHIGAPLPWSTSAGLILDAEGREIRLSENWSNLGKLRSTLIAIAVNQAAGLVMPQPPETPIEDENEAELEDNLDDFAEVEQ